MPARWTGEFVGAVHNAGLTIRAVAAEAGLNEKYVSQVINGDGEAPQARRKLYDALGRMTGAAAGEIPAEPEITFSVKKGGQEG